MQVAISERLLKTQLHIPQLDLIEKDNGRGWESAIYKQFPLYWGSTHRLHEIVGNRLPRKLFLSINRLHFLFQASLSAQLVKKIFPDRKLPLCNTYTQVLQMVW